MVKHIAPVAPSGFSYSVYKCRCEECKKHHARVQKSYRERRAVREGFSDTNFTRAKRKRDASANGADNSLLSVLRESQDGSDAKGA
jgi:hypothetical protein